MGLMLRIMTVYKVLYLKILRTAKSNQEHIQHTGSVHVSLLSRTVFLNMFQSNFKGM